MESNTDVKYTGEKPYNLDPFRQVLKSMCGDMNFLGIISIIFGALNCLSLFGAVIGVPVIFTGIRMRESSEAFQAYGTTDDVNVLHKAIERLSRVFYIYKIMIIIYLVIIGLFLIGILIFLAVGGLAMLSNLDEFAMN